MTLCYYVWDGCVVKITDVFFLLLDRNILYFDENKYGTDNELMKWKLQKYHTIEIVLKSNRTIVGTESQSMVNNLTSNH